MSEFWDLYNEKREPLNERHKRGEPLPDGKYHLVADILSVNSEGKILITKRHSDKNYGGMWEITGGSVVSGEEPLEAAVRELYEETGLKTEPYKLSYRGEIVRPGNWGGNAIHIFYLYKGDFTEANIFLQPDETVDFRLCTPQEIYDMTLNGEFIDFVYERIKAVYPDIMVHKRWLR
ncbi:MAG: NUDIX domain-containing protein [Huintestinicola sp.]